ncbi:PSAP [Mytilus edulis]|uniref:PSAP n=1 Tax=Mytilus edulis TaxID=6550 RepID=A0A8S3T3V1_MYTED|nr:PSAP [Mytilus edulis]
MEKFGREILSAFNHAAKKACVKANTYISEILKASIGCTLCKFLIQEIDNFIVQNQSSAAINASVYNLCSKLPAPLDKLCYGYAPVIVQDVVSGFDPKQTCDKFKLCTNGSLSYQNRQIEFTKDFKNLKDGPECAICKLLVQEIDSYIVQNKSAAEINATVYEFCNKLPAPLNSMCTQYAPMIVKDVTLGFDPEQTCEKVQLCTNGSFVQPFFEEVKPKELVEEKVEADAKCELCEFVVQLLDQYLASNKTTAAVNSSVMQICNLLPGSLKGQCILFAPQVVTMVTSGVAPENACKQAKLCPAVNGPFFQKEITELSCGQCHGIVEFLLPQKYNPEFGNLICKAACPVARRRRSVDETPQIFLEFMKAAKMTKTWRCDLCEWIIEAINAYVQTNVTEQSLEDYMNDICHFMPEPFKDECMKSVPEIIQELSHGFDEDVLCQHYIPDECNGSFVAAVDKPVAAFFDDRKKDKDTQCEICKEIIKYIDGNLNHDKCKSFAAAEMEEILLKIINKILSPEDVCHMITVC